MNKLRFLTALVFAKTASTVLKFTKLTSGTSIIGLCVLKICPNFLNESNKYIKTKINVTGTNGKTTTSGIVSHLINNNNHSVINNSMGANMLQGIVNAVAINLNPFTTTEYTVMESDEAFLKKIYDKFEGDYLVVTNLFRDQLDRYGELEITKRFIQEGINKRKESLTLVLNADDPLVASFDGINKVFYGVENVYYAEEGVNGGIGRNDTNESSHKDDFITCACGKTLKYDKVFYAHQGHYYCDCGYRRPEPKYKADITLYKDFSIIKLNRKSYEVPLVGLFNAYNALAAITLVLELGINNIENFLKTFKVAFGRSEIKYLNSKRTLIQLIKNPAGANEVLKTIDKNSNILIIINDDYGDGRDVSWLWDAEFEILNDIKKEIVVSGSRAKDMALRLKYAGIDANLIKVIPDINSAVDYVGNLADNSITILPTYTALLSINKMKKLRSK